MFSRERAYIKTIDGDYIERNKVFDNICSDCGASEGEYHLMSCDIEDCPVCGLQMYTCECWDQYVMEEG